MIESLSNFHFIRPAWLLLAPVVILVWWLWMRQNDPLQGWRQQIDSRLLDALVVGNESIRHRSKYGVIAIWLLATIAIAGPTWKFAPNPFADDATSLFILLKASESMNASDLAPSRQDRARLEIQDLVSSRKGQPLGLIAYAGSAHLVLPPTRDTAVVAEMAKEISSEIMPQPGNLLDLALIEARRVIDATGSNGSVVIIADSIDTDLARLSSAAKEADLSTQILALSSPDSSEMASLKTAAKRIGATLQPLEIDSSDTEAIIRRAAGTPALKAGDASGKWQETGYFLTPLFALFFLLTFRQEASSKEGES